MPGVVARASATTGSQPVDFLRSGLPGTNSWTPTIVQPAKGTSTTNVLLWWGHILLHVCALLLQGFNRFGVTILQKEDATCAGALNCFDTAPNGGFVAISFAGAIAHIVGVVMILVGSAFFFVNDYKKMTWFHSLMMFCLNFSIASSILVWAMAAMRHNSLAFWLSTSGLIIELWALCMIFSTSAALGSKNIIRTFIFTLTVAIDLMAALLYQVGTWGPPGSHVDPSIKSMAWVCFGCQFSAQVVLLLGRMFTGNALNIKSISLYPFFRSVVLLLLSVSAISSSFRFVTGGYGSSIITSFTLVGTMLSWWTCVYAILPNDGNVYPPKKDADDEDDTEEMDEEEDEEEAIEAKYRRGIKMNRVQVCK